MARNIGLDLLRAVAIILVVLNHSVGILKPVISVPGFGPLFGKGLALFQPVGMLGVELFFVLSGFLIGRILIKTFLQQNGLSFSSLFHFWMRRWLRTIPAYWVALSIIFIIDGIWLPSYYFFLQSYSSVRILYFVESWSLPVEEFFYLLFPLFLIGLSMVFRSVTIPRKILFSITGFIILFTLIRIVTVIINNFELNEHVQIRMMTFLRLDAIGYGVLMAWFSIFKTKDFGKESKKLFLLGILISVIVTGINYFGTHPSFLWYDRNIVYKGLNDFFLFSIYPISFALLIPLAYKISYISCSFLSKLVTHTSKISYSMYLLHLTFLLDIVLKPFLDGSIMNAIFIFILYLLLCYGLSTIFYNWIELPFMNLRERIRFFNPSHKVAPKV